MICIDLGNKISNNYIWFQQFSIQERSKLTVAALHCCLQQSSAKNFVPLNFLHGQMHNNWDACWYVEKIWHGNLIFCHGANKISDTLTSAELVVNWQWGHRGVLSNFSFFCNCIWHQQLQNQGCSWIKGCRDIWASECQWLTSDMLATSSKILLIAKGTPLCST